MEDDWNTLTHRVDSRQKWLHSACGFRHEACDFQPKRMRLIERKIASSGHSLRQQSIKRIEIRKKKHFFTMFGIINKPLQSQIFFLFRSCF